MITRSKTWPSNNILTFLPKCMKTKSQIWPQTSKIRKTRNLLWWIQNHKWPLATLSMYKSRLFACCGWRTFSNFPQVSFILSSVAAGVLQLFPQENMAVDAAVTFHIHHWRPMLKKTWFLHPFVAVHQIEDTNKGRQIVRVLSSEVARLNPWQGTRNKIW